MRVSAPLLCFLLAACEAASPAQRLACRDAAWRPMLTPDGTVALCVAPGYVPRGDSARWERGGVGDTTYAWLSVRVLDSTEAAEEWGTPPHPTNFRAPYDSTVIHALSAESVVVRRERLDGAAVEVEAARISGGVAGLRRQPAIRAVWPLAGGHWALAQGFSVQPNELATLEAMLRTVRIKYRPPAT